ncbi:MAG: succinylglutamate desuccinylase/aspartoacylase family protein, partial [Bdellovibrionales bacterium]|nr:succinylglutamate desuccinylase/aspartoacylase family protein [Bdellovibrionales bacterium]
MSRPLHKTLVFKLLLSLILISSALIFGCETAPIVTRHKVVKKPAKKKATTAQEVKTTEPQQKKESEKATFITQFNEDELYGFCVDELNKLPGSKPKNEELNKLCKNIAVFPECHSTKGLPIFHYHKEARDPNKAKKILTISLIHGDEPASGAVARSWISRLDNLNPRNTWRVIPLANPDGYRKKTRMNVRGVDINRNFPTADWEDSAIKHWKVNKKADPRKYPGE